MSEHERLYLPRITPQDFEAFRKIMKAEIAPTFHEWAERHRERIAMYGSQCSVVEISVDPNEFTRFCQEKTLPYNGQSLLVFAETIGKAQHR